MEWFQKLWRYIKEHMELVRYVIIGGLTTAISLGSYWVFNDLMHLHWFWAHTLSFILAVAFAYVGNKLFVFETKTRSKKAFFVELGSFVAMRLISWGVETVLLFLLIDMLHAGEMLSKFVTQVVVVISNYLFSKFIIFTGKKNPPPTKEEPKGSV